MAMGYLLTSLFLFREKKKKKGNFFLKRESDEVS